MLAAEGEHLDNALRIAAVIENPPEPDEEIDRDQLTRELRDILLWAYIEWRTTAGDTPTEALRTSSAASPIPSAVRCSPTPRRSRNSARQLDIGARHGHVHCAAAPRWYLLESFCASG
jgi:hypothetical protein